MKELGFCIKTMIYKKKWLNYFMLVWLVALLIPFFQFLGVKTSAMAGTTDTSFFLISNDYFMRLIFISAIPLVASLFVGDIQYEEKEFHKFLYMRTSKWKLSIAHLIVSFISCFLLCVLFLGLTFFFTYIMLYHDGSLIDEVNYIYNMSNDILIEALVPFPNLFVQHPYIRIGIYILFYALYAGICGIIADVIGLYATKRLVVYLTPFIITWFLQIVNNLISSDWFIQKVIDPYAVFKTPIGIVLCIILLFYFICTLLAYFLYHKSGDRL